MPFRDLSLFATIVVLAPMILIHPWIGALSWVVFGLLSPHRFTFGPAYDFPFSLVIAILTLVGIVLTRDHRRLKGGVAGIILVVLIMWASVTTIFALTPQDAVPMWWRVLKIFTMTFVLMSVLNTKRHIELLVAILAVSIGFYGVKGGIFTILTGGTGIVNGAEDSVMGNNTLGVANVMLIPLLVHLYQQTRSLWIRWGLVGVILLTAAAVLGSYSRGALLALAAMGAVLWWRSMHKMATLIVALTIGLLLIPFMPGQWDSRMQTIETYEQDGSAMGRIYAWEAAWNIAKDRVTGGGFEYPSDRVMARYSRGTYISVAHSIYFQVLGEHGFVGLGLFLLFWTIVWRQCASVRRRARDRPELKWAYSLMSMTQASLVGYFVGGAFLNLAYWDFPYYLYGLVVVTAYVIRTNVQFSPAADARSSDEMRLGTGTPQSVPVRTLSST